MAYSQAAGTGRTRGDRTTTRSMSPIRMAAAVVGATFLLVGVLGFVPGVTTNFSDIEFIGHESEAKLLGIFQVNILHNIVHLAFGLLGLAAARTARLSRTFLIGGGIVYLALWLYGLAIDLNTEWNFPALNEADNWLHFGLGAGMLALGAALSRDRDTTDARV